jgi:HAD superfamily hydrolase (TIGR01509 family)
VNRAPDAIVFDCDGVLIDTERCWARAYARLFAAYGRDLTTAHRQALIGHHLDALDDILPKLLDIPAGSEQLAQRALTLAVEELATGVTAMPGAVSLVRELHGKRPLAVASSSPRETVNEHLDKLGIADAFDAILGGGDATRPKPAPDIYASACRRLAVVPANAIAIEDSPTGAAAATAAGLYVIGIPSTPHLHLKVDQQAASLTDASVRAALGLPTEITARFIPRC